MNESLWKWWRELRNGSDVNAARRVESASLDATARGSEPATFLAEQEDLQQRRLEAVLVGALTEGPRRDAEFFVRVQGLLAHLLAIGVTGTGKSYLLILLLMALLTGRFIRSTVILDPKGELAELLTDFVLPAFAATLPPQEAEAFLKRIVVIDPFSSTHLPPLNVLVRDPGVPIQIQARDVAECFEAATETDVTARMETILDWVLRLVIETGGSFLTVRRALQESAVLEGLVRLVKDRDVVRYFLTRFPSEPKASKLALLARLDRFLALPMTQLSVGAKVCLDFDRLLDNCITIVSLGRAPAGLQSVARFFAMVVMTRFIRAVFRRPPRAQGFASVILADEWQMTLNSALAAEFESILTLTRSRGVHLWLANQQLAQLDRHGAAFRSAVLGGVANQIVFRLAAEDAATLKHVFPTTGTIRRRGAAGNASGTPFLSPAEERDARVAAASRLPSRTGYWLDRRAAWGAAIPFHTATLTLPVASSLPKALVERTRQGASAYTIHELEQMRDEEEQRLDQLAAGPVRTVAPLVVPPSFNPPGSTSPPVPAAPPVPPVPRRRRPGPGRGGPPPTY